MKGKWDVMVMLRGVLEAVPMKLTGNSMGMEMVIFLTKHPPGGSSETFEGPLANCRPRHLC